MSIVSFGVLVAAVKFLRDTSWENFDIFVKNDWIFGKPKIHWSVPSVVHKIYTVYMVVWGKTCMRFCAETTLCSLTI